MIGRILCLIGLHKYVIHKRVVEHVVEHSRGVSEVTRQYEYCERCWNNRNWLDIDP